MNIKEKERKLSRLLSLIVKAEALKGTSLYSQTCKEIEKERIYLVEIFERLEDTKLATVLYKTYINGLSTQQIADDMYCSLSSVYRWRKKALEEVSL